MKSIKLICWVIPLLLFSCEKTNPPVVSATNQLLAKNKLKITVTTGLSGTLTKREGDCMPITSSKTCKEYPVIRTIYIYEYTKMQNLDGYGPSYYSLNTNLIGQCDADSEGFFQINLSPGKYSIFVWENNSYYACSYDGLGGINPVVIKADSVSILNLTLNYATD